MGVEHSTRKHALLSASGASRWLACTPSARLEEEFQSFDVTTSYAAEGTLAHEFAELELTLRLAESTGRGDDFFDEYQEQLAKLRKSEYYTDEMEEEVEKYVNHVLEQFTEAKAKTPDAVLLIEEKIDLTYFIEDGFGTNDSMIIADGVLEVDDLKYGKGVVVSAVDNPQLKLYGLGALLKYEMLYDIHTVRLTIVQPRLDAISTWEIAADDLMAWGESVVKPKAEEAYAGSGKTVPGSHCKWCKAKAKCRALADMNMALAQKEFSEPDLLEDSEVLAIFEQLPILTDWVASVGQYMLAEALKGKKWEGYKVVEGRSQRKWINPDATEKALLEMDYVEDDILTRKLQGIGAIEKLIGKVKFAELAKTHVEKPTGKPALVPSSDKRPEFNTSTADSDFEN